MITCYCYEEKQKQYSDEISTLIGILASLAFITSVLFITFALKWKKQRYLIKNKDCWS